MSYEAWGEPDDDRMEPAIEAGWLDPDDLGKAMLDVIAERERQETKESWTPEHDDRHDDGQMARAAAAYILHGHPLTEYKLVAIVVPSGARSADEPNYELVGHASVPKIWPWYGQCWKPKDRRRDLVRAAALIVAEIERLDRAAASVQGRER